MDEKQKIKDILLGVFCKGLTASNSAEEKEPEKKEEEKPAENKKACNEGVDKRDIIRQIMAIAGKEEASEDVKTIAKLAEKLAYDKSEAGTADNCNGKKAKNEEEEKIEEKEEVKEEKAENTKAKNEEDEDDKKEDKVENKAKNSINLDKAVNEILAATNAQSAPKYETQADRLELGNKY